MIFLLTLFTLVSFAANSLLCRVALHGGLIDPVSFTTLRLASGAVALFPITRRMKGLSMQESISGSWISAAALFAYAAAFSLAYITLTAGTGALILFGSVQITMMTAAIQSGERPGRSQWAGLCIAIGGLVYLVFPGIASPDPLGAVLMGVSGVAWGVYSIRGKDVNEPVAETAGNFLRSAPFAIIASAAAFSAVHLEPAGAAFALLSGIVTSGLGYILWYRVLPALTTVQASVVQLTVPVLAAFGGAAFLSEEVTVRLVAASLLILGGVGLASIRRGTRSGIHSTRHAGI